MPAIPPGQARTPDAVYRLYVLIEFLLSFPLAVAFTTVVVYRVEKAHLDPFGLVVVGVVLEVSYLLFQLPTGVLADTRSRRACVLAGIAAVGISFLIEGSLPFLLGIAAAQVVRAFGQGFISGALEAWIADELGHDDMTHVFLRGEQAGLVGTLAGTLLSAPIAVIGLSVPLLTAGVFLLAVTLFLVTAMTETAFVRPVPEVSRPISRQMIEDARSTTALTVGLLRGAPFVLLIFGVVTCVAAWSEGFDRLWGVFLLDTFRLPRFAHLSELFWFSALAFAANLLSLLMSELIRRRQARHGSFTVNAVVAVSALLVLGTIGYGLARTFWWAIGAYLLIAALRPLYGPLLTSLIIARTPSRIRATALSARDVFDSVGQLGGGLSLGGIATAVSLRAAMLVGAAALVPATAFGAAMRRQGNVLPAVEDDEPADLPAETAVTAALPHPPLSTAPNQEENRGPSTLT